MKFPPHERTRNVVDAALAMTLIFILVVWRAEGHQLPWTDYLTVPDPSVTASVSSGIVRKGPPIPRALFLSWSNSPEEIGIELLITTNPPDANAQMVGAPQVDTNVIGNAIVLTDLPRGRLYAFTRALPSTNFLGLVEGPITYNGSFSGFEYLPALKQNGVIIKWLTNCPDGQFHFYSGFGLTAQIVEVDLP